ncbi:tRNA (guanine-N(1)-)-methyltransferase [Treponema primitia ZAS-2]|uniref:tRNA (guanine-N(1)-)-methyltransferase n=1 Tax=Treponema primitia (strain ATCC BAA-887 / DSM 12427 / ZAS-2) TaxID=545694 RepID=F5YLS3_TREPZ|nr:tRNA (guanosine(37)-N1)-methyltransferase TrmD [Treponema primitia]AEF84907.1 tRNA (guanine-N(1)-)-methyltransferase [Treponema primitia ZAS-2]
MKYTVLTLFPEIIDAFFASSIMAKAVSRGIVEYQPVNIRDFAQDKHHTCDDAPYGGGAGMLMLPEPLGLALESVGAAKKGDSHLFEAADTGRVIYLSPGGVPFTQELARELAQEEELILLCGRYEGIDQRIIDAYVDDEICVGDYVLSSGEVAALAVIDATYRLVDRVITPESLEEESFSGGLLEYPQYTRPEVYDTLRVPELLLSGHHENIRRWRLRKRVEKTLTLRPDLIRRGEALDLFDGETRKLIQELGGLSDEKPVESGGEKDERNTGD